MAGSISVEEQSQLGRMTADSLRLLQLDDIWTSVVQNPRSVGRDNPQITPGLESVVLGMITLLESCAEHRELLQSLAERMDEDDEAWLALILESGLFDQESTGEIRRRADEAGGFRGLALAAADGLASAQEEIYLLQGQLRDLDAGTAVAGDLTRKFRCNLGMTLLTGGLLSIPPIAAAAVGTGIAAGAVGAGLLVGATGGIAAIPIVIAGLIFMARSGC